MWKLIYKKNHPHAALTKNFVKTTILLIKKLFKELVSRKISELGVNFLCFHTVIWLQQRNFSGEVYVCLHVHGTIPNDPKTCYPLKQSTFLVLEILLLFFSWNWFCEFQVLKFRLSFDSYLEMMNLHNISLINFSKKKTILFHKNFGGQKNISMWTRISRCQLLFFSKK